MPHITPDLADVEFLPRLDSLDFTGVGDSSHPEEPCLFSVSVNGKPVLEVNLRPVNGRYTLAGLPELLQPYIRNDHDPFNNMDVTITAAPGGQLATLCCIPCYGLPDISAKEWLQNHWLTFGPAQVMTYMGASEPLAVLFSANVPAPATADCILWNELNKEVRRVICTVPTSPYEDQGIYTLDCSPDTISHLCECREGERLICYDITCGARLRRYTVFPPEAMVSKVHTLRFLNAFGMPDVIHFFGGVEESKKAKFDRARFGTSLRNYKVDAASTYKISAGFIGTGCTPLVDDLLHSCWVEDVHGGVVILTDCQYRIPEQLDKLPTLTVSVQDATGKPTYHYRRPKVFSRVFDSTFE